MAKYKNRADAGQQLARLLEPYREVDSLILAIPNGGVVVGAAIAQALGWPLDLIVVRKIPIPWEPEAGFGAVTSDGTIILNQPLVQELDLKQGQIKVLAQGVWQQIQERVRRYGASTQFPHLQDKQAVLVDDGLASGVTMEAAVTMAKRYRPAKIMVAIPTAHTSSFGRISSLVDEIICPDVRGGPYFAVADAYEDWYDLSDGEVISLLKANDHGKV